MAERVLDCRGCYTIEQLNRHIDNSAMHTIEFVSLLPDRLIVDKYLADKIRTYHLLTARDKLEHRAIPCEVR